jgi:hypothetical protein
MKAEGRHNAGVRTKIGREREERCGTSRKDRNKIGKEEETGSMKV